MRPFRRARLSLASLALAVALGAPGELRAQTPPPPLQPAPGAPQAQPFPPQQAPQPYPPQQAPQQPQPYPPYPQQAPPQGYPPPQQPPQAYPPQGYPPPQQPPQAYPPQTYPPQAYPPQAPAPGLPPTAPVDPRTLRRSRGEMAFLYGTSAAYGVGTGIWIDALAKVKDPGVAVIAPLTLGLAMPVGVYFWDDFAELHRGVPSSVATGLTLGAVEGIAIAGTQWQYGRDTDDDWSFGTQTTVTFLLATGGGVGGWAFGEWIRPDPRSLGFIASGAGWGAITGTLFGAGVSGRDWKDGASVAGLVGYNAGILAAGAITVAGWTPSWQTQKYMWLGDLLGTLAGFAVYPAYLFVDDADVKRGLIANAIGGLAGVAVAGALTWDLTDDEPTGTARAKGFSPPFHVGVAPSPSGQGATVQAFGTF